MDGSVDSIKAGRYVQQSVHAEQHEVVQMLERKIKVERRQLEFLLTAPEFVGADGIHVLQRIAERRGVHSIGADPKLKIGAKSKKHPTLRILASPGQDAEIEAAVNDLEELMDTKKRKKVTLRIELSKEQHSFVIGKRGENIKEIMVATGCHIHFPDTARHTKVFGAGQPPSTSLTGVKDQVSITGLPVQAEHARHLMRGLLPMTISFDIPESVSNERISMTDDVTGLARELGVTIFFKQRVQHRPLALVKGPRNKASIVERATLRLLHLLTDGMVANLEKYTLQFDIPTCLHGPVIGTNGSNIRKLMALTDTTIRFPDASKSSAVFVSGPINQTKVVHIFLQGLSPFIVCLELSEDQLRSVTSEASRLNVGVEDILRKAESGLPVQIGVKLKSGLGCIIYIKTIEAMSSFAYRARIAVLDLIGMSGDHGMDGLDPFAPGFNRIEDDKGFTGALIGIDIALNKLHSSMDDVLGLVNKLPGSNLKPHDDGSITWHPAAVPKVSPVMSHTIPVQLVPVTVQPSTVPVHVVQEVVNLNSPSMSMPIQAERGAGIVQDPYGEVLVGMSTRMNHLYESVPVITSESQGVAPEIKSGISSNKLDATSSKDASSSKDVHSNNVTAISEILAAEASADGTTQTKSSDIPLSSIVSAVDHVFGNLDSGDSGSQRSSLNNSQHLQGLGVSSGIDADELRSELKKSVSPNNDFIEKDGLSRRDSPEPIGSPRRPKSSSLTASLDLRTDSTSNGPSKKDRDSDFAIFEAARELKKAEDKARKARDESNFNEVRVPNSYWAGQYLSQSLSENMLSKEKYTHTMSSMEEAPSTSTHDEIPTEGIYPSPRASHTVDEVSSRITAITDEAVGSHSQMNGIAKETEEERIGPVVNIQDSSESKAAKSAENTAESKQNIDAVSLYWNVSSVDQLLKKLKMESYISLLHEQEIDLPTLLMLEGSDLEEIGIKTFGARKKLCLAIADLKRFRTRDVSFLASVQEFDLATSTSHIQDAASPEPRSPTPTSSETVYAHTPPPPTKPLDHAVSANDRGTASLPSTPLRTKTGNSAGSPPRVIHPSGRQFAGPRIVHPSQSHHNGRLQQHGTNRNAHRQRQGFKSAPRPSDPPAWRPSKGRSIDDLKWLS